MIRLSRTQPGQSIVLFAVFAVTLLVFVGLAIDSGMLYLERRHLQNMVDAACLAGATDIAMGNDGTAASTALAYLNENLSANASLAFNPATLQADIPTPSGRDMRVSATIQASAFFLRLIDIENYTVAARAHCDATKGGGIWPVAVVRFPGYDPDTDDRVGIADTGLSLPQPYGHGPNPDNLTVRDILQAGDGVINKEGGSGTTGCGTARNWYNWPSLGSPPAPWGSGPTGPYGPPCAAASPANPGVVVEMAGLNADPNVANGGAYSGPLLLDYRQVSHTPHLFYNGMNDATATNAWKDRIVQNLLQGYQGPDVLPGQELAVVDGVNAGNILDAIRDRYNEGDEVTALIYNGVQYKDPDFTLTVTCQTGQAPIPSGSSASCTNTRFVRRAAPPAITGPDSCVRNGDYYIADGEDAAFDTTVTPAAWPAVYNVKLQPVSGAAAALTIRLTARLSGAEIGSGANTGSPLEFADMKVRWTWPTGSTGWQSPNTPVDIDMPLPSGVNATLEVIQSKTEECIPDDGDPLTLPPAPVTVPVRQPGAQTIQVIGTSISTSSKTHSDYGVLGMQNYSSDHFLSFAGDPSGAVDARSPRLRAPLNVTNASGTTLNYGAAMSLGLSVSAPGGISARIINRSGTPTLDIDASGVAPGEYDIDVHLGGSNEHSTRFHLRVEPPSNPSIDSWVVALCYAKFRITDLSKPNVVEGQAISGCESPNTITSGLRARLLPW